MKNQDKINSFENKIKKSFIKYGRIPFLLVLAMIFMLLSYERVVQPIVFSKITQNRLEKKIANINESLFEFMETSSNIESNEQFYQSFYDFSAKTNIRGNMIIYDKDNKVQFITQPSIEGSVYGKIYNRTFLERVKNSENQKMISSVSLDSMNDGINTLMLGSISKNSENEEIGIIYFLDSKIIKNLLQHQSVNHVLITDANDYVVATTSDAFVGRLNRFTNESGNNDNNLQPNYNVSSKNVCDNSLKIHALTLEKPLLEQYGIIILFMGLTLMGYQYANKKVAERVGSEASVSINKLVAAVNTLKEGDLEIKVDIQSNDEFEMLGDEFNTMAKQLNTLVNRNQQLLELRKNAQIKQLEAQFNPHFLYNSLETIRYLISFDQKRAQKMILNITQLLRYSIDGGNTMVVFKDDLAYLQLYLEINKIRLDERFDYNIDVSDNVLELVMPKLMIQPLIENSIKHGYRNSDRLNLQIIGSDDNDNIYISVIDDGGGMSDEVLENVKKLSRLNTVDSKNYGLHSIIQRLNLIYGKNSRMEITSDNDGTSIKLVIPRNSL